MFCRNIANVFLRNNGFLSAQASKQLKRYGSMRCYDPDYLDSFVPEIPVHDTLIVQLKGYDYPILENFQKYINKIVETLDIEVDESWGLPTQKTRVQRFKPTSTIVDSEYLLTMFERNLQFVNLPSNISPILFRLIQEITPEGVTVNIMKFQQDHLEIRFVPDNDLIALKQQLTDLGGPAKPKKKK